MHIWQFERTLTMCTHHTVMSALDGNDSRVDFETSMASMAWPLPLISFFALFRLSHSFLPVLVLVLVDCGSGVWVLLALKILFWNLVKLPVYLWRKLPRSDHEACLHRLLDFWTLKLTWISWEYSWTCLAHLLKLLVYAGTVVSADQSLGPRNSQVKF